MKRILVSVLMAATLLLLVAAAFSAPPYVIGGKWLLEGSGKVYANSVPGFDVALNASGTLNIYSVVSGDEEYITSMDVTAHLDASKIGISAWDDSFSYALPDPYSIDITGFNPTMSKSYTFPAFSASGLSYTITLTSVTSGTVAISGKINVSGVGDCTVHDTTAAIWKDGTPKPSIPDTGSNCDAGFGAAAIGLVGIGSLVWALRRRK